ncbi:MAG: hypothetical protein AB9834_08790 [Lentimicrobium sp.]
MNQINKKLNGNHNVDVDNLISRMEKEDSRNKRMMKSIFNLYLVCTVLYTLLFVINPDPDLTIYDRVGGLCYVSAFLAGTFFFRKEYQALKKTDYSLPLLQLLRQNEVRYRFFSLKWLYMLGIVVLIGTGISLSFSNPGRLMQFSLMEKLMFVQGIYWSIITVSGFIGYRLWKKRSYPIWKDSKTLLDDLNS